MAGEGHREGQDRGRGRRAGLPPRGPHLPHEDDEHHGGGGCSQAHEAGPPGARLGDVAPQARVERGAEGAGGRVGTLQDEHPEGADDRQAPAEPQHPARPRSRRTGGPGEGEEGEASDEQRQADVPDEASHREEGADRAVVALAGQEPSDEATRVGGRPPCRPGR